MEHLFTTPEPDQDKALDEAVEFGKSKGWQLISIIWSHKNSADHHCFTISFVEAMD